MSSIFSWADLPVELLEMIGKCLKTRLGNTRFRSVCTSWRSSTPSFQNRLGGYFGDFRTTEKTIYCIEPLVQLSSSMNYHWLVALEEFEDRKFHLLNPFTGLCIEPHPSVFPEKLNVDNFHIIELRKLYRLEVILNPEDERYKYISSIKNFHAIRKVEFLPNQIYDEPVPIVLQLNGNFYTPVDNTWIPFHEINNFPGFEDIASYKGKVYAITNNGKGVVVDSYLKVTEIEQLVSKGSIRARYLVESSEDLYLVVKYESKNKKSNKQFTNDNVCTGDLPMVESFVPFKVYKLRDEHTWSEITNLDGGVLFIGQESPYWSFFVPSTRIPGFKGNCIFFTGRKSQFPDTRIPGFKGNRIFFTDRKSQIPDQNISECYHTLECSEYKLSFFDMETGRFGLLDQFPGYGDLFWPPPSWLNVGN